MWPADGPRWVPPPRQVDHDLATADWLHTRCRRCRETRRVLVARAPMEAHCEVTIPCGSSRGIDVEAMECNVMA
eukprot:9295896-Lingulodinium_polyedra.AAC.1